MTAQAQTTLPTFAELEAAAQSVTMETFGDFLKQVAAQTVTGLLDDIQRHAIIEALAANAEITAGKQLVKTSLKKVEGDIKRALQNPPDGIQGGRGLYSLTNAGVMFSKPTKDGYAEPVLISPHLRVIAETYDISAGNNGRLLEWKDSRGRVKTWPMPAVAAAGDGVEIIKQLRGGGLNFVYGRDKEIIDYILSTPSDDLPNMTCTDRTGWVNGVYVTPHAAYGENAESYIYQPVGIIDNKAAQAGTLTDWQANVARYAQNNPLLMTAISLAFTGALLNKVDMMGFGLHIFSGSSSGKTTSLQVAASVWGREFWQQWLATSVGLEGSAHAHNDGLLCLDEIGEATAQTVSATAYALANGEGKRRGGRDGNAKITKKWRVAFLSTGEHSLDHMMKAAGMVTRAGQEVRMINIKGDVWAHGGFNDLHGLANGSEFSEMLKASTAKVYGVAGVALLEAITAPGGIPEDISQAVDVIRESFLPEGASGQVRRVARQFALTAYAGELATKHGVTGWKEGEATAAAKECFLLWVDGFGGADGSRETRQIIESVESFLFANISRFHDMTVSDGSIYTVKDRVGFVRSAGETKEFIIPATQLVKLAEGYSKEQIITALRTVDMVNAPGKDGKAAIVMKLDGKSERVFIISPK
ncbi:DUF927 domain-containing protein [Thiothrix unzii]|jgi:uncharacterized protein (DUF927 family)|uniref:DUF927 domain-containing protein n=1 Tax=Thiothrix unzii TaxID=111769 RepID=UPI002A365302|nr:DUF927 domain-containing protein [Thiothrix unzii]MDX9990052.1 DUF927 domain-containing protein [Thiothrix unzii]